MTDDEREVRAQQIQERRVWRTPDCCDPMRRFKVIIMSGCDTPDDKPEWYLRLSSETDHEMNVAQRGEFDTGVYFNQPTPMCCPFCDKCVPNIVKSANPPSPMVYVDDGYCKTCGERAGRYGGGCACWAPWFAWEVQK